MYQQLEKVHLQHALLSAMMAVNAASSGLKAQIIVKFILEHANTLIQMV
jgi:hypothetical protein